MEKLAEFASCKKQHCALKFSNFIPWIKCFNLMRIHWLIALSIDSQLGIQWQILGGQKYTLRNHKHMELLNQSSLKNTYFWSWQCPITIITNINITYFCFILIFYHDLFLICIHPFTFIFHLHHELFPLFKPVFALLLYFGYNIISLRFSVISFLPLLMSGHVSFICWFSAT